MVKEISWGGVTGTPSDYECADGDLELSVNLIHEDGGLHPIPQPECVGIINHNLEAVRYLQRFVLVHKVGDNKNWIVVCRDGADATDFKIGWIKHNEGDVTQLRGATVLEHVMNGYRDISAVGNMLVVSTVDGLRYILWNESKYEYLGERPPFVTMQFSPSTCLSAAVDTEATFTDEHEKSLAYKILHGRWHNVREINHGNSEAVEATMTDLIIGAISKCEHDLLYNGSFMGTIFVRYAFRLYDQSYKWYSPPILIQHSVWPIVMSIDDAPMGGTVTLDGDYTVALKGYISGAKIHYRLCVPEEVLNELKQWGDIIQGIDVFFSSPIRPYALGERLIPPLGINRDGLYGALMDKLDGVAGEPEESSSGIHSDGLMYGPDIYGRYGSSDCFVHIPNNDNLTTNVPIQSNYHAQVKDCHVFYKVAEFALEEIMSKVENNSDWELLPLKNKDLSIIETFPTLPAETSDYSISAASLTAFNSRLYMSGISRTSPQPYPSSACIVSPKDRYPKVASRGDGEDESTTESAGQGGRPEGPTGGWASEYNYDVPRASVRFRVYSKLNNQTVVSMLESEIREEDYMVPCWRPKYIFYPEPTAYRLDAIDCETEKILWSVNLTPHEFLNGAYSYLPTLKYLKYYHDLAYPKPNDEVPLGSKWALMPSKIYGSEVDNPFIFPSSGVLTAGSGEVKAVVPAVRALSQGQFGQFPLYAFTSEGVWSISIDATGASRAVQPVSREVAKGADSILQLDKSVLFISDRGVIELGGGESRCVSDVLNSSVGFDAKKLPGMRQLEYDYYEGNLHETSGKLEYPHFRDFLENARMAYDYTHQRVLVFNKDYYITYVLSLKSGKWGMMEVGAPMEYMVNNYPDNIVVTANVLTVSEVLSLSKIKESAFPAGRLLLSRPLKLGQPDVLKTFYSVHQRFDAIGKRREVPEQQPRQVLWGSRDMVNWHLITSARSLKRLCGFGGSPYKYFRVGLSWEDARNKRDLVMHGMTIEYRDRFVNRVR